MAICASLHGHRSGIDSVKRLGSATLLTWMKVTDEFVLNRSVVFAQAIPESNNPDVACTCRSPFLVRSAAVLWFWARD